MKKILALILAAVMMMFCLVACNNAPAVDGTTTGDNGTENGTENNVQKPEKITITCMDGSKDEKEIQLEVPYDPQKIAVCDMAALDILVNLGLEDRIVCVATTTLDYLVDKVEGIPTCGTIKTPDAETIMKYEPDLIFMGGRGSDYYATLSEIAPVVRLTVSGNVVEGTIKNAQTIASIFGKTEEMSAKVSAYNERIEALQAFAKGKSAIVGMVTSGGFNVTGNSGRCSIIGNEIGFANVGVDKESEDASHGNLSSFEYILQKNPQYIFVMDRDAATGGASTAAEVMNNEVIDQTIAAKNGNVVILARPGVWYTAEGGFTALGMMLEDLENALLK
ncbi:MAG: ABC transporter substrate-binding protein [Clostridia bacterium]|nr:ABC transporter substrate-binding protein [Clostridia bacterium]